MKTSAIPQIKLTSEELEKLNSYTSQLQEQDQIKLHPDQAMLIGQSLVQFNETYGINEMIFKLDQFCFTKSANMVQQNEQCHREETYKEIETLTRIRELFSFFTKVPVLPNI